MKKLVDRIESFLCDVKVFCLDKHAAFLSLFKKYYPSKFIKNSPYSQLMRLDKPTGYLLTMLPAWWIIAFAADSLFIMLCYFIIFGIGAVIVRGAGCVINDLIDRKIDKKVKRTKSRPIASGKIEVKDAIKFLCLLLVLAAVLLLFLPPAAIKICLFAIIPIAIYPLVKRYSYYPQVFLGVTFNLSVLIAWFTMQPQQANIVGVVVYIATILWTIGFDTIYAHQDKKDDIKVGVKSTALKFGAKSPEIVWNLYKLSVILIGIAALNFHMNFLFYIIFTLGIYTLYWQTENVDINDPDDCLSKFKSNVDYGWIVLIAILIGKI